MRAAALLPPLLALALVLPAAAQAPQQQADPRVVEGLQAELRATQDLLAAANRQLAATVAAATLQLQAMQKRIDELSAPQQPKEPAKK